MWNDDNQKRLDTLRVLEAQRVLTGAERTELDALFAELDAEEAETLGPALERMRRRQAEGAFLLQRLRLNRPQLVAYRLHRRAELTLHEELDGLHGRIQKLQQRVSELNAALAAIEEEVDRESR